MAHARTWQISRRQKCTVILLYQYFCFLFNQLSFPELFQIRLSQESKPLGFVKSYVIQAGCPSCYSNNSVKAPLMIHPQYHRATTWPVLPPFPKLWPYGETETDIIITITTTATATATTTTIITFSLEWMRVSRMKEALSLAAMTDTRCSGSLRGSVVGM